MEGTSEPEPDKPPPLTLLLLPEELLFCILEYLDDTDLYQHIRTCRTLHHTALHTLFNRHCKTISSSTRTLTLQSPPPYILRALHGALFVKDIRRITISFSDDINQFYVEVRLLTELIDKLVCNTSLELSMAMVGASSQSCIVMEELTEALQRLMDTALRKGCTFMTILTNPWLKSLYGSRIKELAIGPKKKSGSKRLSGFVKQLGSILSGRNVRRGTSAVKQLKDSESGSSSTPVATDAIIPSSPPPPAFNHTRALVRGALIISTDLLLEPLFIDWTLNLLNTSCLTKLCFTTKNFGPKVLQKFLPKITIRHLEVFALSARRHDLELNDLVLFLARHSTTLHTFTFGTAGTEYIPPEPSIPSSTETPPLFRPYLNFPRLASIVLSSYYFPWFVQTLTSNPIKGDPPYLSDILVLITEDRPNIPNMDQALEAIAELAKSGAKGYRFHYWMGYLTLSAKRLDTPVFVNWLKKFSEKHAARASADDTAVDDKDEDNDSQALASTQPTTPPPAPRAHSQSPPNSSTISFPPIRELNLEIGIMKPHLEAEMYKALPGFLSLFPNLVKLRLGQVSIEIGKKQSAKYWQGLRERCTKLHFVKFCDGSPGGGRNRKDGAGGGGEEVLMNDLVQGKFEPMYINKSSSRTSTGLSSSWVRSSSSRTV
ncbi:hypothetical protein BDN72DRAFT_495037 [Pluteus cervinus]|uniref:Uncharacterized protein n=1 Tax=Pluteus cervinus TaxID=181527 RepID=A0ACD3AY50_9AGAR|nr:hypothetical protein BDN72DRAFT_495037 [Pluteus cervinus]